MVWQVCYKLVHFTWARQQRAGLGLLIVAPPLSSVDEKVDSGWQTSSDKLACTRSSCCCAKVTCMVGHVSCMRQGENVHQSVNAFRAVRAESGRRRFSERIAGLLLDEE